MRKEEKYYPLHPMQRWLINAHLAGNINSTMMNISKLLKLDQSIDMERLANSIYRVLNIYDIFRCRFALHPETGKICQKFDGEIDKIFVEHMSDKEFAEKIKTLKKTYHIIGNQLYRIRLIETPTTKYLYLDFYHAIMDGVAIAILFWHKFDAFYRGGYIELHRVMQNTFWKNRKYRLRNCSQVNNIGAICSKTSTRKNTCRRSIFKASTHGQKTKLKYQ